MSNLSIFNGIINTSSARGQGQEQQYDVNSVGIGSNILITGRLLMIRARITTVDLYV